MCLAEDPSFKVRKAAAEHLVEICKVVVPLTFTQKMFPLFCTLAADTIWGVRKAAADNIVEIAKLCNLETRLTVLTPILLNLLQDISHWVQRAALQRLGEFIATLMPNIIPAALVDSYSSMAVVKSADEEEVVYQCAYNFPAVLLACGKSQWEKLKGIYKSLWDLDSDKVTHTLCCSLHEVAKILGKEISESELMPIFLDRIQTIDENLFPLLQNAPFFLDISNEDQKDEFLETLQMLHEDSKKKWRVREKIAENLYEIAKHYNQAIVFKKIWGLAMLLCGDDTFNVRKMSAKVIWKLLDYCKDEEFVSMMKGDIQSFAKDDKWIARQLFCIICKEMWSCTEFLTGGFLEQLAELAKDKTPGVRIMAANALKTISTKNGIFLNIIFGIEKLKSNELIIKTINDLKNDSCKNVKEILLLEEAKQAISIIKPDAKIEQSELITEEQATKIDIEAILKEIETEGPDKIAKMPVGMKIDEIDA